MLVCFPASLTSMSHPCSANEVRSYRNQSGPCYTGIRDSVGAGTWGWVYREPGQTPPGVEDGTTVIPGGNFGAGS